MQFAYSLKTEILFGRGRIEELGKICAARGWKNGLLVCDPMLEKNGLGRRVASCSGGAVAGVFSEITPNPTVSSVDGCVARIEAQKAEFIIALGGGSSLDCAKAASVTANTGRSVRCFHSGGTPIQGPGLPILAVPTTAGTGSEVTNVAVLSDPEKGLKGPMASDFMFAKAALLDPALTLTVPPQVVASTGLDVLSHALEGYWSKGHQPICDAAAVYAAKLVFENLPAAYSNGADLDAKEQMCVASLLAGLAFGPPKTAAAHACSFPLTNLYHLPHGEACAFTLDALVRYNCETDGPRLEDFAHMVGFPSADSMADAIRALKERTGMRCTLAQAGIPLEEVPALARACQHPNLQNNPTPMTQARLEELFYSLA